MLACFCWLLLIALYFNILVKVTLRLTFLYLYVLMHRTECLPVYQCYKSRPIRLTFYTNDRADSRLEL